MVILLVILGLAAVVGIWLWTTYNSLVKSNVRVDSAWSDITVQLKRRADLIPNLVEAVKGYAKHEKEVFTKVTEARAAMTDASGPAETAEAENMFTGALKSLFAVAEAYPELKADQNFRDLQTQLVDTENKIQASRRFYNGSVEDLNIKIQVFPTNIFAKQLGFSERELFEVEDRASIEEPVEVKF